MTLRKTLVRRHLAFLSILSSLIASGVSSADTLDGSRAGDSYGSALSVQTVQTQFGDNSSELDAGYANASIENGLLRLIFTGNLESNFNRLNIFIDSQAGGQNTIGADTNNGGVNPGTTNDGIFDNYSGVGSGGSANGPGFTFDTGFEADYVFIARNGNFGGDRFDFNFLSVGNPSVSEETFDIFSGSTQGSNASVGASAIGVAFNNSNAAGILGGTGAANATAAQAVETGLELWIPLAAIGNPGAGDTILISAHVNASGHDFLSNQSLGGFSAPQGNLGGDGAGSFNNDVSLINLNNFIGDQFFSVIVAHDNDGDNVLSNVDNCPDDYNPLQEDFDGDGVGYVCDVTCASSMDIVHNFNSDEGFDLQASGQIMYKGNIPNQAEISFDAGLGVELKGGTSIALGALVTILTAGCVPMVQTH